jgi:hypothetical protein
MGTNHGLAKLVPPSDDQAVSTLTRIRTCSSSAAAMESAFRDMAGRGRVIVDMSGRVVQRFWTKAPGHGRGRPRRVGPTLRRVLLDQAVHLGGVRAIGVGLGDGPCPQ